MAHDPLRCDASVWHGFSLHQCPNRARYDNATRCKIHCAETAAKKRAARTTRMEKIYREIDRRQAQIDFKNECRELVREIALGHNDARGAAQALIEKYKENADG